MRVDCAGCITSYLIFVVEVMKSNEKWIPNCCLCLYLLNLPQKVPKSVIGVNGGRVAETTAPVDLNGVWKPERGRLLKSQQKTQYHVQPLRSPGDARWP